MKKEIAKILIAIICLCVGAMARAASPAGEKVDKIVIDKEAMTLTAIGCAGDTIIHCPMACGKNYGNKRRRGDCKTPEGRFTVASIEDSHLWTHDFGDGKGQVKGAYGPWFIRLSVPGFRGIGIHGTHDPASMGKRASEGCIRLTNDNIAALAPRVAVGTTVVILPSQADTAADRR